MPVSCRGHAPSREMRKLRHRLVAKSRGRGGGALPVPWDLGRQRHGTERLVDVDRGAHGGGAPPPVMNEERRGEGHRISEYFV